MANYTRCLPGCPHPRAKSTMKHQGFRWGHLVYGFQFHFEINAAMIQDRLGDKGCCTELAAVPEIKPEAIRRQPSAVTMVTRWRTLDIGAGLPGRHSRRPCLHGH